MSAATSTRITLGGYSVSLTGPARPVALTQVDRAATAAIATEAATTATATPTAIHADPQAPPVTPAMRYRVWRQPHGHVDHAYQSGDEQFYVQASTLAQAVQLERVLEAYDTWCEQGGEHDIEIWDGTTWSTDIDPVALSAAETFLRRIYDLEDIPPVATGRERSGHADSP
jgi:hypothetical protein